MPAGKHDVALYGGAFNPSHPRAHAVVRRLLRAGFERVLVMPCHGHTFGKRLAPALDRLSLGRAAEAFGGMSCGGLARFSARGRGG